MKWNNAKVALLLAIGIPYLWSTAVMEYGINWNMGYSGPLVFFMILWFTMSFILGSVGIINFITWVTDKWND